MFPYPQSRFRGSSTRNPSLSDPVHHGMHHDTQATTIDLHDQSLSRLWTGQSHSAIGNVLHSSVHAAGVVHRSIYPPMASDNRMSPSWGAFNEVWPWSSFDDTNLGQYRSSSSSNEVIPPLHARSLYETIPLPEVDITDRWEVQHGISVPHHLSVINTSSLSASSSGFSWPPNPPSQNLSGLGEVLSIRLHPILQSVYLSPRHTLGEIPLSLPSPVNWIPFHHHPATWPSVRSLEIQVYSTADIVSVRPTTPQSLSVVTVEDVLRVLGDAFIIEAEQHVCHGSSWSCGCNRLSVAMNSLELWWTANEHAPGNQWPWRLVVGRR